ncbi:MAG TPA: F0F1 ATP synthase subunit B [Propionibacteriaceae bacterium]|nr:F0F1 ATP synthase subunit B [Propionibacteriaceae bacterium]
MIPLEGTGPLGPLLPDHPSEFVVGIVLFFVILLVVWKKVVPAFETLYASRADAIRGGIERAEQAQAEAKAALEQYRAQLAGAKDEASRIREDAKNAGAQVQAEMRTAATAESARIVQAGHAQVEAERAAVREELRRDVGTLATQLAEKIVGESLTDDARAQRTVDRFIAELDTASPQA